MILPGAFHLLQSTGSNHDLLFLHSVHREAYLHPKTLWSNNTDMFSVTVVLSDIMISFLKAKLLSNIINDLIRRKIVECCNKIITKEIILNSKLLPVKT